MKFSLFVHMQRLSADQPPDEIYGDFISLCTMADEGGMSAIWTGEHHAMDFAIVPNPFISVADLARCTSNVRLGTGTIAPFWHPIRLAGEAAMADIITGGRLDIGLARGAYSYEYDRLRPGIDGEIAARHLHELVPAVKKLWAGDYAHDGEFHRFSATTSLPKPLQQPAPPLWIGARHPASYDFALANGCNIQVMPLWLGDSAAKTLMDRFNEACERRGNDAKSKIMILQNAYVAETDDDIEMAAHSLSRFYCSFDAWFRNERPVHQGSIEPLTEPEMATMDSYSPANLLANMPIGRPREVTDRLKRYEDLGYDEYSFWIDSGMTIEQKRTSLARFIDKVMPAFS